jgi:predicted O-methyltransferase YrrM
MRAPVDTFGASSLPRRCASALVRLVAHAGMRLERLEDTRQFGRPTVAATTTPLMMGRFSEIPGMVTLRRGMYLYWLAYSCSVPGDIVEIGAWQGRATAFLAQACEDADSGVVHVVDTFGGNPGKEGLYAVEGVDDLEAGFRSNMEMVGLSHRVEVYPHRSDSAIAEIRTKVESVRMVCIDGDHSFDAVSADLAAYGPLLAPGSLLVLDDYSARFPGVVDAANAYLEQNASEFTKPVIDSGLLVVRRRA